MEQFDAVLKQLLEQKPGLSKARIAEALKLENNDEFREQLDAACDRNIAHKMMDKFYPGPRKSY